MVKICEGRLVRAAKIKLYFHSLRCLFALVNVYTICVWILCFSCTVNCNNYEYTSCSIQHAPAVSDETCRLKYRIPFMQKFLNIIATVRILYRTKLTKV